VFVRRVTLCLVGIVVVVVALFAVISAIPISRVLPVIRVPALLILFLVTVALVVFIRAVTPVTALLVLHLPKMIREHLQLRIVRIQPQAFLRFHGGFLEFARHVLVRGRVIIVFRRWGRGGGEAEGEGRQEARERAGTRGESPARGRTHGLHGALLPPGAWGAPGAAASGRSPRRILRTSSSRLRFAAYEDAVGSV